MKRVLIFSTAYLPLVGGAEVAVKEITDRIGDIEFDLITARMDGNLARTERLGNINVYRLGWGLKTLDKFILPISGYFLAKKLHRENNYQTIWSIMASQASVAAAFFKKKYPEVKLLLTLQEGDEEEYLKRYALGINFLYKLFIRPWHLMIFKRADYITVISNYLKERVLKHGVKCPIGVVPNGVDIEKFQITNDKLQINSKFQNSIFKKDLGINEGEKIIIHTGRLAKKNGLDDLIKSLKYLPENVKFLLLGTGQQEDELRNLTKGVGLEQRILFLGHINHSELPAYLAISDVFVRPSLSEGLGNSFLEAMAAGVPVIGTRVGGIPDFLQDGQTGLFCEVRNPQSIAEKIKVILSDESLREKITTNAKKMVQENYDWNMIAMKMMGVFEKM